MENLLQSTSLVQRAFWLVKLRWVAIATLGIATFVASNLMGVSLSVSALYIITGVLLVYNFILYNTLRYSTRQGKEPSPQIIGRMLIFQISADLFILATILHFSGGIENPFLFFFVFHMIIASILRSRLKSFLQATLAVFLFGAVVVLESRGVIAHYELTNFAGHGLYKNSTFIFGFLFVFATTLYLVVYMTTSISEQVRKQQESCRRANELLKEKDKLKNEYVLRLTHDIKGHLAAIESCIDIVDDEIVGPLNPKQKDLIDRAYRRTTKCMAFVTALLQLTRMKLTGRLDMDWFSLKNCVFDEIAAVQGRAREKSIDLSYEIDASVDEIYGEAVLIEETIMNLLLNAVKYTSEGGKIRIDVKDQGESVLVRVSDTGIGVPREDIDRVFEEFYRAPNARAVERDGTGLGLSFARQVVERHGGKIWVQNNPGGGSTFSFTVPKRAGNG
jgi:signal transduction histidine kinase